MTSVHSKRNALSHRSALMCHLKTHCLLSMNAIRAICYTLSHSSTLMCPLRMHYSLSPLSMTALSHGSALSCHLKTHYVCVNACNSRYSL